MYLSAEVIAKTACLSIAATCLCLSVVPPHPKPTDEFREKYNDSPPSSNKRHADSSPTATPWPSFDYNAASTAFGTSYLPYLLSIFVVVTTTLDVFHAFDLFPSFMPVNTHSSRVFNVQLITGLAFTIIFSALRFTTFMSLGRLFTYQLSILPDHKLITHGLYSYVRHPSYTAIVFIYTGAMLTVTAPGSVLHDFLGTESTGKLMVTLASAITYGTHLFIHRAGIEDQVLRKEFGKEWDEWASVVKYKFIPGLL